MVIEIMREDEQSGWRVTLARTNFRPDQPYVEIQRLGRDPDPRG